MRHLTHTGPWAGQPFCGQEKTSQDAHPNPVALEKPHVRETFCKLCLAVWDDASSNAVELAAMEDTQGNLFD